MMVKVGKHLYCTYMADKLVDAKFLEAKLNLLGKSVDLYYENNAKVKPHPSTTETCYAFRGLVEPCNVYIFPSEGNILGITPLNKLAQESFRGTGETSTVLSLDDVTFVLFRNYLSTPEISDAKYPGYYKKV
jgi:hypothetical protein